MFISALALFARIAEAQSWPAKPVKFVVPYGPGIGIDIMGSAAGAGSQ
jgi:tripartite-type tricarboxylate transporter receptor subunit TctC